MGGDDDQRLELIDGDPAITAFLDAPGGSVVLRG
jgi:hypothetical protein